MNEVGPIEQLTIDEVTFQVADLPEEIQKLVAKYEDWRDRLTVAQDEALIVASALRDLGANIVGAIKQQEAQAAEAAAADDTTEPAVVELEVPVEVPIEVPVEEAVPVVEEAAPVEEAAAIINVPSNDTLVVEDDAAE